MHLASDNVLPLRFSNYGSALMEDINGIRADVTRRDRTVERSPFQPDFSSIIAAIREFDTAGSDVDRVAGRLAASGDNAALARFNDSIMQVERAFLRPQGLPGRPWFRHQLIAPGLTTGYAPWPFPAIREAVEKKDRSMFESEAAKVVAVVKAATRILRAAARH